MSSDPDRPAVPGLEPADGRPHGSSSDASGAFDPDEHPRLVEPVPPTPLRGLDMSQDPDRYDPDRAEPAGGVDMTQDPERDDAAPVRDPAQPVRGLDMTKDPDRFLPPGQGQTLTDLLGPGAQEGDRDGYQWVAGLLGVFAFLALVAFLFNNVLTP